MRFVSLRSAKWFGTAALGLAVLAVGVAQAQDVNETGKVMVGAHKATLKAGEIYHLEVTGKFFRPNVSMANGFLPSTFNPGQQQSKFISQFLAQQGGEKEFFVAPQLGGRLPVGPLEYTFVLKQIPLNANPVFMQNGTIAKTDPAYPENRNPHKAFNIPMKEGKFYVIDLKKRSANYDPYLFLEDPTGKIIQRDDDGGGFPDARILVKAGEAGAYRVIASGLGSDGGDFELIVREEK